MGTPGRPAGRSPSGRRRGTSPMGVGRAELIRTSEKGGRFASEQAPSQIFRSTHVGYAGMHGGGDGDGSLPEGTLQAPRPPGFWRPLSCPLSAALEG